MENKKIMIPVILGVILLCGVIFTVVYKKTDGTITKEPEIETLAPKETQPVETRVVGGEESTLSDFDVNETKGREAGDGKDLMQLDVAVEQLIIDTSEDNESEVSSENLVDEADKELIDSNNMTGILMGEDSEEINAMLESITEKQRKEVEDNLTPEQIQQLLN